MLDSKFIDEFSRHLNDALPSGFNDLRNDVDKNLKAAMQATLSKLELVTREEFEIQQQVLIRTRLLLEQLELRVTELEGKPDNETTES